MIAPSNLILQSSSGVANMGTVTDKASLARFGLDVRWVLAWLRIHFTDVSGTASSTLADVKLFVDSRLEKWHDTELWIIRNLGKATDAFMRIASDEYVDWTFEGGDQLVATWTNPDPDDLAWAIEAGVARAEVVF